MTTQLEEITLELKLREVDRMLTDDPKNETLLKERLLTLAEMMRR